MQIFLDTTDTAVLKDLASTGLVDGVTTNPSLIAKSGRPMLEVIAEICDLVEGPVSAEVAATETEAMLAETRRQNFGDEQIVFINAWNEWAEGAHLEPDVRFGHGWLEALRNAAEAELLEPRP